MKMSSAVKTFRKDVDRIALPNGRMVGTEGHAVAKRYLLERFHELGLAPYRGDTFCLSYQGEGTEFTNLIGDMSDQGVFRRNNVPYLFLSCGRWPHYHVKTDTPDRLNYRKMHRIMRYLVRMVAALCSTALDDTDQPVDTVAFEIRTMRRALGPLLPIILRVLGIGELKSREDIDAFASAFLSTGL